LTQSLLGPIKNKSIEVINNLALDRSTKNFYEEYKRLNIQSMICLPINYENMEADYLVIYADKVDHFDENVITLLAGLSKNLLHANAKYVQISVL